MINIVTKEWGLEEWLVNEPEYCAKRLILAGGKQCSVHYHPTKKETFIVESGVVRLFRAPKGGPVVIENLVRGDSRTILPGTAHRFASVTGADILEVSSHHDDTDVVRLEPSGDYKGDW